MSRSPGCRIDDAGEAALPLRPLHDPFLLVEDGSGGEGPVDGGFADRTPITASHRTVRDRWGQVDTAVCRGTVGEVLQEPNELIRVDGDIRGDLGGELTHQLGGPPRRLPGPERLQRPLHHSCHRRSVDPSRAPDTTHRAGDEVVWFVAERGRPCPPPFMQLVGVVAVGLGGAAVEHRLTLETPPFPFRRLPFQIGTEPTELLIDALLDGAAALRELRQHLRVDTHHLGNPMFRFVPSDSEAAGQLGTQPGVIQTRQGPLIHLQRPGIQGQPASVRSLDPVGDHRMGVELRVETPARVLTEHPGHDAFGVDAHHMTPPPQPGVRLRLHPTQHGVDRPVVRLGHLPP